MILLCPLCWAHIGRRWQPFNVSGGLSISWECQKGHAGQINGVEVLLKRIGRPPTDFPPLAAVDYLDV